MSDETSTLEILYSPAEVSDTLKVKESTLRKYVGILESSGYNFSKNNRGHRQYKESDVIALKRFISASERPDMTLETAAEQLVSMYKTTTITHSDTTDITLQEKHSKDISELMETVNKQTEVIRELMKCLEERDKKIKEQFQERDKRLMEGIRQIQDQKEALLQLAANQEENNKKGLFARLFNR
jgi:DNA-binding transcriptional MerR regulator